MRKQIAFKPKVWQGKKTLHTKETKPLFLAIPKQFGQSSLSNGLAVNNPAFKSFDNNDIYIKQIIRQYSQNLSYNDLKNPLFNKSNDKIVFTPYDTLRLTEFLKQNYTVNGSITQVDFLNAVEKLLLENLTKNAPIALVQQIQQLNQNLLNQQQQSQQPQQSLPQQEETKVEDVEKEETAGAPSKAEVSKEEKAYKEARTSFLKAYNSLTSVKGKENWINSLKEGKYPNKQITTGYGDNFKPLELYALLKYYNETKRALKYDIFVKQQKAGVFDTVEDIDTFAEAMRD